MAYELTQFVTLTFRTPVFDYGHARVEFRGFVRRLRRSHHGPLHWVAVVEPHASGAFHVHLALRGTSLAELRAAWRPGHVDVRRLRSADDRRAIASYMAPAAVAIGDQYDALMRELPREVDVQDAFVASSERLEHLGESPDLDDV